MQKIIIFGNGFIASHFDYEIKKDRLQNDVLQIRTLLERYSPDVVINCIGYCGITNIDDCETRQDKTILCNTIIPTLLASETHRAGIQLVNIGSGCIFSGKSPNENGWQEADTANPQSFYSNTKYSFDLLSSNFDNICNLRIRMPISFKRENRNFITKVSNYSKIIDIQNSMTIVDDLVRAVDFCIQKKKVGTYHITNPGTLSAKDIMEEYSKYKSDHKFSIISEQELDKLTKAKRSNCILNSEKIIDEGFDMQNISVGMRTCMKKYFM